MGFYLHPQPPSSLSYIVHSCTYTSSQWGRIRKCPRPLSRPTTSRSTLVAQPAWSNLRSPLWDTEGASQNTLIDSEFLCGSVSKIWSLFRSTRAATIMVRTEKIMPMPILGRMSMPLRFPWPFLRGARGFYQWRLFSRWWLGRIPRPVGS